MSDFDVKLILSVTTTFERLILNDNLRSKNLEISLRPERSLSKRVIRDIT